MRGDVRCVDMYKLQLLDPPNDTKTIAKENIHGRKGVYLPTYMYHTHWTIHVTFNVGNYISPMTHGSEIGLEIGILGDIFETGLL